MIKLKDILKESISEDEEWSSYEQRMVKQIVRAKKEGRGMYTLPMKTQDFYRKHKDKFDESVNESQDYNVSVGDIFTNPYARESIHFLITDIDPNGIITYKFPVDHRDGSLIHARGYDYNEPPQSGKMGMEEFVKRLDSGYSEVKKNIND